MSLKVVEAASKEDRQAFLRVPHLVFAQDRNWVAPLDLERSEHLDPKKNPYFQHADVALFVAACGAMVKPGGLMIAATINRTLKSFALAIVGAEYVLRWLPRGTHEWNKFVTPDELTKYLLDNRLVITEQTGVVYSPFADKWSLSSDMDVNYMMVAEAMV